MTELTKDQQVKLLHDYVRANLWQGVSRETIYENISSELAINIQLFNSLADYVLKYYSVGCRKLYLDLMRKCIINTIY